MAFLVDIPRLGFGLGLRMPHFEQVLAERPVVDWFEVISENFMDSHQGHVEFLQDIRADYPLVLHGVGLGIGNSDPLDEEYLAKLASLAEAVKPTCISDHLCFTSMNGVQAHDLLPVPYTREALAHISDRVKQVQDKLGQRIALENPSSYVAFTASQMSEWQFLAELAEQADCMLLLDLNNIYVSARNHGFDAMNYMKNIPSTRIAYLHLAGHQDKGEYCIDTHDTRVSPGVWQLYRETITFHGIQNCLIEWDNAIPPFEVLLSEIEKAKSHAAAVITRGAA